MQLGDTTTNYQVMPGDRIYVATRTFCESFCQKRACPLCQGLQCPCPSTSALLPSLPTITPPRIIREGTPLPIEGGALQELPVAPPEMPTAPADDEAARMYYESDSPLHRTSAVVRR